MARRTSGSLRMGCGRFAVARVALVEEQEADAWRRDGDHPQVRVGRDAVDVGPRRRDVVRGVGLAARSMLSRASASAASPEDDAPDRRRAEEEPLVRGQLDELARHAPDPPVRAAADRGLHERRPRERVRRDRRQQVGRERRHVKHGVVELLGVRLRVAEHDPALALGGHRRDCRSRSRQARRDARGSAPARR